MHRTPTLAKMASTRSGMRKILKRDLPVQKYIRMAVETGIYKPKDEDAFDPRPKRGQRAQLPKRGLPHDMNEQFDYPIEYEIITLNPPVPEMPRIPKKLRKEQASKTSLPTDRLVRNYMRRYDLRMRTAHPLTDAQREEKMYARVLGLSQDMDGDDFTDTAMGRKQMVLDHAYKFAIKQYEVLRAGEEEGMTEQESVNAVEELLAKEAREERSDSRTMAREATEWREAKNQSDNGEEASDEDKSAGNVGAGSQRRDDAGSTTVPVNSIPSILAGKPRTIRAMTMWSRRMAAVPYDRWTLGAATALDHWIACDVLGMDELSWKAALRGEPGEDEEVMTGRLAETVGGDHHSEGVGVGNAARAKDIVTVRSALFPETVLFSGGEDDAGEMDSLDEEDASEEVDATQRSIDELLASLGGFDDEEEEETIGAPGGSLDEEAEQDAKVAALVDELQEWRTKNVDRPYDEWSGGDKADFNTWLNQYIAILTADSDGPVDLDATREALLSEPPLSRDDSDKYWSNLADETEAEIYLQDMLAKGAPPKKDGESDADRQAREDMGTFLSVPYERQLRKLVDMGTLRPVFDEYTPESDRAAFMRKNAAALMEGMDVEHLVSDPAGPIRAEDVGVGDLLDQSDVKKGGRYRIDMVRYGSTEYGSGAAARGLWRAWNAHKAGRATYEEVMFKKGKIGLEDKPLAAKKGKGKKRR